MKRISMLLAGALLLASSAVQAAPLQVAPPQTAQAIFAGGCFWCEESTFQDLPGVLSVVSGYTGGHVDHPTYEQSSSGTSGHTEAVEVTYDPAKVSYADLLRVFWVNHDATDNQGQFCDRGTQYRPGIFYLNEAQHKLAEASKTAIEKAHLLDKPIRTEITKAGPFWPAEAYHQDYYKKNPIRYKYYRYRCGRDQRLESLWGGKKLPSFESAAGSASMSK